MLNTKATQVIRVKYKGYENNRYHEKNPKKLLISLYRLSIYTTNSQNEICNYETLKINCVRRKCYS